MAQRYVTLCSWGHSKPETTRRYVLIGHDRVRTAAALAAASWPDAG